jgi:hypothetical protein
MVSAAGESMITTKVGERTDLTGTGLLGRTSEQA